ncbi:MAG TPA: CRTAC1 family protein [Puia sp.]|nr:CRTAC1 family protein [Puia sp.]
MIVHDKKRIPKLLAAPALAALVTIGWLGHKRSIFRERKASYEAAMRPVDDKNNAFYPEARVRYNDSLLKQPQNTPRQIMAAEYGKAEALLQLGEEPQAIELLTDVVTRLKLFPGQSPGEDPRKLLALAWLRQGERNNCLSLHSSGSCIFPIQTSGIYSDPLATQNGIDLYQTILADDADDLASRWLLNLAYMTIGKYPSGVPPAWLIPGMDKDSSPVKVKAFRDIAGGLGLANSRNEAGGTIVDDFDNDGYLDLVTSDWDPDHGMHFYRNNGDGSFTDVSLPSGLSKIKGAFNLLQVDYNNDGYTDIFVLRGGWRGKFGKMPKTLLRNNGDGTFTDVTVESGLLSLHPTQTAVWADFNKDGWPDVFIGQETTTIDDPHPCELWLNNKDGTFTEVARQAGCDLTGFVKGVASADYDRDNLPDIFLSLRDGRKVLLRNTGVHSNIPHFENVTHRAGLDKDTTYTFPTWFWDYDNDGWPDIFVCGYAFNGSLAKAQAAEALHLPLTSASTMYLYRNNHDGTFSNVTKTTGLDKPVFAMGSNFGDIDNDGWLDMYLGTGNPDFQSLTPNRLFKNMAGRYFADVTGSARVGNLQKGHGVAIADLNNDGYEDIFIETGGAYKGDAFYNSLYCNPGQNDNNWITIKLEGTVSNRSAIGAHLAVTFTENGIARTVYRDVSSGGSFGASPLRQHIGIGQATTIDTLRITWPATGKIQWFTHLAPRQFIRIREGENKITKMTIRAFPFKERNMPMNSIPCAPPLPLPQHLSKQ